MKSEDLNRYASQSMRFGVTLDPSIHKQLSVNNPTGKDNTMNFSNIRADINELRKLETPPFSTLINYVETISGTHLDNATVRAIDGPGRVALRKAMQDYLWAFADKKEDAAIQKFEFDATSFLPPKNNSVKPESALAVALKEAVHAAVEPTEVIPVSFDEDAFVVELEQRLAAIRDSESDIVSLTEWLSSLDHTPNMLFELVSSVYDMEFTSPEEVTFSSLASDLILASEEGVMEELVEDEDDEDLDEDEDDEDLDEADEELAVDGEFEEDDELDEEEDEEDQDLFDSSVMDALENSDYLSGPSIYSDSMPVRIKTKLALIIDMSVVTDIDTLQALKTTDCANDTVDFYNAFAGESETTNGGYALSGLDSILTAMEGLNVSNTVYVGDPDSIVKTIAATGANFACAMDRLFNVMSGISEADETATDFHIEHSLYDMSYHVYFDADSAIPEATITLFLTVRSQNMSNTKKIHRATSRINDLLQELACDVSIEVYAAVDANTLLTNDAVRKVARGMAMLSRADLYDLIESRMEEEADEDDDEELEGLDTDTEDEEYEEDDSESDVEMQDDYFPLVDLTDEVIDNYLPNGTSHVAHIVSLNLDLDEDEDEDEDDQNSDDWDE